MYARLRYEAGLTGDSNLLDMGCGVGALPLQLDLYAPWSGSYHGIDVDNRMIAWCQGHLSGQRRTYDHFDYWNGSYNTGGQRFIPFPVEDNWADVIVMKSVFTHMLPEDVDWYLLEVARVLRPDGSAVLSALLFNGDELDGFPHDGGIYRYQRAASPESSIALRRSWMDERMAAAGLTYQYTPAPGPSQRPMLVRHLSAN
jgi:ubiquinone/menaquinone biosynthesis C-methylase UbiE